MPPIVGEKPDLLDWAAAAAFALASVVLGLWAFVMILTLILLPVGIVVLIVAVLAWYAAKGVFSRDREAWWVGLLVAVMGVAVWVPGVLRFVAFARMPSVEDLVPTGASLYLLTYLVLRRDRYGIGRRLPASMTLGYPAEKAK